MSDVDVACGNAQAGRDAARTDEQTWWETSSSPRTHDEQQETIWSMNSTD